MPGVGPWCLSTEFGPWIFRDDFEVIGESVLLLPEPEHPIDEAVVKEEDRIESSGVVFTHVTVGSTNRRGIEDAWHVKSPYG